VREDVIIAIAMSPSQSQYWSLPQEVQEPSSQRFYGSLSSRFEATPKP
jgi:hypothetical protein